MKTTIQSVLHKHLLVISLLCAGVLSFSVAHAAAAATLAVTPPTGVYTSGGSFTVRVVVNTAGQSINAAEGKLTFDPRQLSVVGVSRASSIFNLWTQEPTFSNSSGLVSFGGGSPNGYSGTAGTVVSVTFRALGSGTTAVKFSQGSVLAADGRGTNVLTNMSGGSYTINAASSNPTPEYVAPPNTPAAPVIKSSTHPDPNGWYATTTANVSWNVPTGITEVRTLLDQKSDTIPTKVYDHPIDSLSIPDLPQGVSYLHVQFKNKEGWGRVAHYRLGVDTEAPTKFTISQPTDVDHSDPKQPLIFNVTDGTSPVHKYQITIDGKSEVTFNDASGTGAYTLPTLEPGKHTVIVEAFDGAGNSITSTFSFEITSFTKPKFTDYPTRMNTGVVPVIKGTTKPGATLTVSVSKLGGEARNYDVVADDSGTFTFIPDGAFQVGIYDLGAVAVDTSGAKSDPADTIRIVVEQPGYIQIGSFIVSVLSVLIPLLALILLLSFGLWYLWHRLRVWRRRVRKEAVEAENTLAHEFDAITKNIESGVKKLKSKRKGKLTKAESTLIDELSEHISAARSRIKKEVEDIDDVLD